MKVDYSNKWFIQQCKDNGLDPNNVLSQSAVDVAREHAKKTKYWLGASKEAEKKYDNWEELKPKFDKQINRHNNARIEQMLYALDYAVIADDWPPKFNEFLKNYFERKDAINGKR